MRPLHIAFSILAVAGFIACGSSVSQGTASSSSPASTASSSSSSSSSSATTSMGEGGHETVGSGGMGGTSTVGTGGAGGGVTCPGGGDPCSDCVSMKCPDEYCACYGNLACGMLFSCYGQCMDDMCRQACLTKNQNGISAALILGDCAAKQCMNECPGTQQLTPCQECLYTKCDIQMNQCVANPECDALFACLGMCKPGDMACRQACGMAHPNGVADAQAVGMCAGASCPNVCM